MLDKSQFVSENSLRGLLEDGHLVEVICKMAAEKHGTWEGEWGIRAVQEDGDNHRILMSDDNLLNERIFRSILALVSFLAKMGCKTVAIPLEANGCALHATVGNVTSPRQVPVLVISN